MAGLVDLGQTVTAFGPATVVVLLLQAFLIGIGLTCILGMVALMMVVAFSRPLPDEGTDSGGAPRPE